jgi:hypothetical protein
MTRFLLSALLLAAAPLAAQSGWRFVQTTDEFTAASDARLILREDGWPTGPQAEAAAYHSATLLIVCGHRIPGDSGRTLLLSADQPMQPFANLAYVEMRFDSEPQATQAYFTTQQSDVVAPESGHRYSRYVAFLGTEQRPYFSPVIFTKLLKGSRLRLRYRAFGTDRTASFHIAGLRGAMAKLSECHWNE